jgi:protein-S-isoprenylcysteine O-methyltransferase Ste14
MSLIMSLTSKGAVVLSVFLHEQVRVWKSMLHPHLQTAAPPGALCVLFWPPPGIVQTAPGLGVTGMPPLWWARIVGFLLRTAGLGGTKNARWGQQTPSASGKPLDSLSHDSSAPSTILTWVFLKCQ